MLHFQDVYTQVEYYSANKLHSSVRVGYILRRQDWKTAFLLVSSKSLYYAEIFKQAIIYWFLKYVVRMSTSGLVIKESDEPLLKSKQFRTEFYRGETTPYELLSASIRTPVSGIWLGPYGFSFDYWKLGFCSIFATGGKQASLHSL